MVELHEKNKESTGFIPNKSKRPGTRGYQFHRSPFILNQDKTKTEFKPIGSFPSVIAGEKKEVDKSKISVIPGMGQSCQAEHSWSWLEGGTGGWVVGICRNCSDKAERLR